MHKVHRFALLFALLIVTSCAGPRDPNRPHGPTVWWQEGKTAREAKMDFAEAKARAAGIAGDISSPAAFWFNAAARGDFVKEWMLSKGYEPKRASTVPDGFNYPEK